MASREPAGQQPHDGGRSEQHSLGEMEALSSDCMHGLNHIEQQQIHLHSEALREAAPSEELQQSICANVASQSMQVVALL